MPGPGNRAYCYAELDGSFPTGSCMWSLLILIKATHERDDQAKLAWMAWLNTYHAPQY